MTSKDMSEASVAPELPLWAAELLDNLDHLPLQETDDHATAVTLLHSLPDRWLRRLVYQVGTTDGLHGVHDFVRRALHQPNEMVLEIQTALDRRFTKRHRTRIETAVRAHGLGIVRAYRMKSSFHPAVYLFFNLGETELTLVAEFLEHLVGIEEARRKLFRKLMSRDPELREYVLYLLAEFADDAFFPRYADRLAELYNSESNEFVREAFEYLFELGELP